MIDLTSTVFISRFHKAHEKYSHISPEEMKLICHGEFRMMKDIMNSNILEEIRFQYLFVLRPSAPKVVVALEKFYQKRDTIDEMEFTRKVKMFKDYIRENPLRFKKYEQRLKNLEL